MTALLVALVVTAGWLAALCAALSGVAELVADLLIPATEPPLPRARAGKRSR